jgi:Tfp pilus assembly protein PilX
MNKRLQNSRGQVVLMVLLASALVLTLGLSAAKQATIETSIDTDQELLKRAFNAAESGIEYFLKTGETSYTNPGYDGNSKLEISSLGGNTSKLSNNNKVGPEEAEFFWLVNHNTNGDIGSTYYSREANTISICIDDSDKTSPIGLKIDYFYKEGTVYKVKRGNGDGGGSVTTSGGSYPNNCFNNYVLSGDSILLAVTPMGISTKLSISGGANFQPQGQVISSTGSVGNVNNLVTIEHPYKLYTPFLLDAVVTESVVINE